MATTIYGIKNCDTIKKARRFLDDNNIDYHFHDYRVDGVDKKVIAAWVKKHGWETVLNKRGTTWRQLDDATKEKTGADNVADLLVTHPAMIKRPILVNGKSSTVGFSVQSYTDLLDSLRA